MALLTVELVTPMRKLFATEAESVTFTGALGEMTVLPGHIALVTALRPGPLTLKKAGGVTEIYAVGNGTAQIDQGRVTVLAEAAERSDEIDAVRAQRALEAAQRAMKEQSSYDEAFAETQASLARAATRLTLASR
jgi:F-type H+-transporting ATPase subunit epsilon